MAESSDNKRLRYLVLPGLLLTAGLATLLFFGRSKPSPARELTPSTANASSRDTAPAAPSAAQATTTPTTASAPSPPSSFTLHPSQFTLPPLPPSPLADALGAKSTPPENEPRIVLDILRAYQRELGVFPTGEDNRAILRPLTGANAKHLAFIPPDHARLDTKGQLLDGWGTPFFFHVLSHNRVDVRSAGPDHEFYTPDDIVAGLKPQNALQR